MLKKIYTILFIFTLIINCVSLNKISSTQNDIRQNQEYNNLKHSFDYFRIDNLIDGPSNYNPQITYSHFRWFHTGTPYYFYPSIHQRLYQQPSVSSGVIITHNNKNSTIIQKTRKKNTPKIFKQKDIKNKNKNYSITLPKNFINIPQTNSVKINSSSGYSGKNSGGTSAKETQLPNPTKDLRNPAIITSDKKNDQEMEKELEGEANKNKKTIDPKEKIIQAPLPDKIKKLKTKKLQKENSK